MTDFHSVVALCQALVSHNSLSGQEAQAMSVLQQFAAARGFDAIHTDRYGSLIMSLKGNRPGPVILLDGHMDVVPVPDPAAWQYDPFGAEIVNGRIYGRGTTDMKGGLSAMAVAMADIASAHGRDFAGEIHVSAGVHEECFEGVAAREIVAHVKPDLVIVGEPSDLKLKIGQRGRAEIVVETIGKSAHSGTPAAGINAVLKMTALIQEIEAIPQVAHPRLGSSCHVPVDIQSHPYPGVSIVPERCRATYDKRTLPGETRETILADYRQAIDACRARDPEFQATVSLSRGEAACYTGEILGTERLFPAWLFAEHEPFIQQALSALHTVGLKTDPGCYPFCTNGSYFAGEAGIRTIGIGPSPGHLAHIVDEYIEIAELEKAVTAYRAIVEKWLEIPV